MKSFIEQIANYELYHTKKITKLTHFIGVPSIIFSLQMLLSLFSLAWFALILLLAYYFIFDKKLACLAAAILVPITFLAGNLAHYHSTLWDVSVILCLFIGGWILQLLGHWYEGNRPALLDNFSQIFIAPIFLVAEVALVLGYRKDLQQQIILRKA